MPALRFVVTFLFSLAAFTFVRSRVATQIASLDPVNHGLSYRYLAVNCLAFCTVFGVYPLLLSARAPTGKTLFLMVAVRWALLAVTVVSAGFTFIKPAIWGRFCQLVGFKVWCYSFLVGSLANPIAHLAWSASEPLTDLTFRTVAFELSSFGVSVVRDAQTHILGTPAFAVQIAPECSGMEGLTLTLVFGGVWLWLFRKEYRFPRAFVLLPTALTAIWTLNSLRIAALILIGSAGAPQVAMNGFHSQAGWIAFMLVACGMWLTLQRVGWLSAVPHPKAYASLYQTNPTSAYLLPFLSILLVSMLSRAASNQFEWLYPLRLIVAGSVLWVYRSSYRTESWTFSWLAPLTGAVVFILWLAADSLTGLSPNDQLHDQLTGVSPFFRAAWVFCRTTAAIITVPIAEELAFRSFLMRRIISSDFERIPYSRVTWLAMVLSSVVFGVLHGDRWPAGILAGLCYSILLRKTGRLGNAVVAHATSNGLIAVAVLFFGKWNLW